MATTGQDRMDVTAQQELLYAKYVGTGHPDTTKFEWNLSIKRDTAALLVGSQTLAVYQALGENESVGRVRFQAMQSMLLPCGVPPERDDE